MHLDCSIGRLALAGSTVFVISQIVVGEILAFVVLLLLRDLMSYPFGKRWYRGGPTIGCWLYQSAKFGQSV